MGCTFYLKYLKDYFVIGSCDSVVNSILILLCCVKTEFITVLINKKIVQLG